MRLLPHDDLDRAHERANRVDLIDHKVEEERSRGALWNNLEQGVNEFALLTFPVEFTGIEEESKRAFGCHHKFDEIGLHGDLKPLRQDVSREDGSQLANKFSPRGILSSPRQDIRDAMKAGRLTLEDKRPRPLKHDDDLLPRGPGSLHAEFLAFLPGHVEPAVQSLLRDDADLTQLARECSVVGEDLPLLIGEFEFDFAGAGFAERYLDSVSVGHGASDGEFSTRRQVDCGIV